MVYNGYLLYIMQCNTVTQMVFTFKLDEGQWWLYGTNFMGPNNATSGIAAVAIHLQVERPSVLVSRTHIS